MAVPGHDERDFDFAQTYGLPIKRVLIETEEDDASDALETAFTEDGYMVNSGLEGFDGEFGDDARACVIDALEEAGKGDRQINWKIRPWLISRQRYWGTPIPIIQIDMKSLISIGVAVQCSNLMSLSIIISIDSSRRP